MCRGGSARPAARIDASAAPNRSSWRAEASASCELARWLQRPTSSACGVAATTSRGLARGRRSEACPRQAGLDLEVDAETGPADQVGRPVAPGGEDGAQRALLGRDQLDARQGGRRRRLGGDGVEDEDGRLDVRRTQGDGLVEGGDTEQAGAAGQEGAGGHLQAVAVAVGLDDRGDARPGPGQPADDRDVVRQGVRVDLQPCEARQRRQAGRRQAGLDARSGGQLPDGRRPRRTRHRLPPSPGHATTPWRNPGVGRSWLARRPAPGDGARGRSPRAGRRRPRRRRRIALERPRRRRREGRRRHVPHRPAGSPGRAGRRWSRPARHRCRPWPGPGSRRAPRRRRRGRARRPR